MKLSRRIIRQTEKLEEMKIENQISAEDARREEGAGVRAARREELLRRACWKIQKPNKDWELKTRDMRGNDGENASGFAGDGRSENL